jgi:hypothetical protein
LQAIYDIGTNLHRTVRDDKACCRGYRATPYWSAHFWKVWRLSLETLGLMFRTALTKSCRTQRINTRQRPTRSPAPQATQATYRLVEVTHVLGLHGAQLGRRQLPDGSQRGFLAHLQHNNGRSSGIHPVTYLHHRGAGGVRTAVRSEPE